LSADPIVCYSNTWVGPKYTGMITPDLFPNSWNKIEEEGYNTNDLLN
jgi:hypothetical protein